MEVRYSDNPHMVAAQALSRLLEQYANVPILLLVSGGSALAFLEAVESSALGDHITVSVLDERFVSDQQSHNFSQLESTHFYQAILTAGGTSISTKVLGGDCLATWAARFADGLRDWRQKQKQGVVLVTMGVGNDGHTAGLFPNEEAKTVWSDEWVTAYQLPESVNQFTDRLSVTGTFLREQVAGGVAFVIGEEKRLVLNRLQTTIKAEATLPAGILYELSDMTLVTDVQL